MEDMLGKMGEILSDPESVRQLQELAQMLQQENGNDAASDSKSAEENGGGLNMGTLLKIQELMGAVQQEDSDAKLLLALRPHLKQQRQKKLDQAVKLLKLYAVFSVVKENGMLQDFLS